jgi:hypothetical protein
MDIKAILDARANLHSSESSDPTLRIFLPKSAIRKNSRQRWKEIVTNRFCTKQEVSGPTVAIRKEHDGGGGFSHYGRCKG